MGALAFDSAGLGAAGVDPDGFESDDAAFAPDAFGSADLLSLEDPGLLSDAVLPLSLAAGDGPSPFDVELLAAL